MVKIPEKIIKKTDTPKVVARPPVLYGVTFGLAWLLDTGVPIKIPVAYLDIAGYVTLGIGAVLLLWAMAAMRGAQTPLSPYKPSTALVVSGPFRFSRNPVYLGLSLCYLGLAMACNNWWAIALFPLLMVIMLFGVIFREERYLLLRFGSEYLEYKMAVRRWL